MGRQKAIVFFSPESQKIVLVLFKCDKSCIFQNGKTNLGIGRTLMVGNCKQTKFVFGQGNYEIELYICQKGFALLNHNQSLQTSLLSSEN